MRAGSLLAAAAIALAGVADAAVRRASGLHDARYCEIIELKGAPPRARGVVWNSIKLNRCPAAQWNALDAGALATELGDTLVIKNGPRHFLMDSASARTGRVRSFQGIRMRRVVHAQYATRIDLGLPFAIDRHTGREKLFNFVHNLAG